MRTGKCCAARGSRWATGSGRIVWASTETAAAYAGHIEGASRAGRAAAGHCIASSGDRNDAAHADATIAPRGSNMTTIALDSTERALLQRRVLRVLALGQIVGGAALASAVTVGAFVVQDILGDETPWAGMATATTTVGTAFMSQVLARKMSRRGRRPGLQLGYAVAVLGGAIAAVGVERTSSPLFLVGLFLFGNGQAANLLARYAATDLAEPDERGSDGTSASSAAPACSSTASRCTPESAFKAPPTC